MSLPVAVASEPPSTFADAPDDDAVDDEDTWLAAAANNLSLLVESVLESSWLDELCSGAPAVRS